MDPQVRARHVKSTLALADELDEAALVRGRTPPEVLAAVERAYGSDWLPVAHDVALTRALRSVLGPERHGAFCTEHVLKSFEGPLLRTLVQTALAVIGRDLPSLARWIPKGWNLMFTGCGTWAIEPRPGANEIRLVLSEVPDDCIGEPVWMASVADSMSAIAQLAQVSGRMTLERLDPAARTASYMLRW